MNKNSKSFLCRYCSEENEEQFHPSNKSLCKKCKSLKIKIERGTADPDDKEIIDFLQSSGIDGSHLKEKRAKPSISSEILFLMNELSTLKTSFNEFKSSKDEEVLSLTRQITEQKDMIETLKKELKTRMSKTLFKSKFDSKSKELKASYDEFVTTLTKLFNEYTETRDVDIISLKEQINEQRTSFDETIKNLEGIYRKKSSKLRPN
jgi:hypothetical protein